MKKEKDKDESEDVNNSDLQRFIKNKKEQTSALKKLLHALEKEQEKQTLKIYN